MNRLLKALKRRDLISELNFSVGSMTAKQKKGSICAIADGTAGIIVGTHALIQEKVEYKELALCYNR